MELTGLTLTLILVQTDSNGDHEQGEYGICSDNCPVSVSAFVSEGGGEEIRANSFVSAGQN